MTKVISREYLEIEDEFWKVEAIQESPDRGALLEKAGINIQSELKKALRGLGPLFGRENLLRLCAAVIEEDFNADGPQTPLPKNDWE